MQIGGCQGLGTEENGEQLFNVYRVYFCGDENILELDRAVCYTTHCEYTKWFILKWLILYQFTP